MAKVGDEFISLVKPLFDLFRIGNADRLIIFNMSADTRYFSVARNRLDWNKPRKACLHHFDLFSWRYLNNKED